MGYKLWGFEELLTSNDLNTLIMSQSLPRFNSTGERNAAITSPEAGQYAHIVGTGLTRWTGTDWVVAIPETAASTTTAMINFTSFYSTWSNYGSGYTAVRYGKDSAGFVHVEGMLRAGASSDSGEYALVLPSGYRPAAAHIFSVWCRQGGDEKGCRINLNPAGQLQVLGAGGNFRPATTDWLSISGISFRAA